MHSTAQDTSHPARPAREESPASTRDRERVHRRIPFWAYVVIATTCAVLLPAVAALGASLEGADALIRVVVAGVIASLAGLAISASAAATKAADRRAASVAGRR